MLLDISANRFHQLLTWVAGKSVGTATQARAEACALRFPWTCEEADILTPRSFRGTGGPAIHACRCHCKHKLAVAGSVAREHSLPAGIIGVDGHGARLRFDGQYRTVHG